MSIVRYENPRAMRPWNAFEDLERELAGAFSALPGLLGGRAACANDWVPAVDVTESKDAFNLEADLPGLGKEDVKVSVEDGILSLKGERNVERTSAENGQRHYERRSGSFERSFRLPKAVEADKIKAKFDKGVLQVTLPKSEAAKPKRIEIKCN